MKMVQLDAGSAFWNSSRPIGSHASGLTGRRSAISGVNMREKKVNRPIRKPSGMPTIAARPNPIATRWSEARMFQPIPMSFGPSR
ncbi:hypothetical protein D3C78_1481880 [compost metagenome]